MTAECGLKWLLRFIAFTTLFTFAALVMPQSWLVHFVHKADPDVPVGLFATYSLRMLMGMFSVRWGCSAWCCRRISAGTAP